MSRQRTATSILEARGAFRHNPDRKRVDPKVTSTFPATAPSDLTPIQVQWWHRVVEQVPAGILTGADLMIVRICACLSAEYALDPDSFPASKLGHLRAVMGSLGMSPADRAKLATAPAEDDDEF